VLYTLGWTREDGLKVFRPGIGSGMWLGWKGHTGYTEEGVGRLSDEAADVQLPEGVHPITYLISHAEKDFKALIATETTTLHDAAAQYRKQRSRHPPPGYEAWYAYAVESGAVMIESFWDQIYEDLKPFWSIDPVVLRKQTHVFSPKISIRNGKVEGSTNNAYEKLDIWADLLRTLAVHPQVKLPDVDIPVNVGAESAMLVPWEILDTAVSMARPMMVELEDIVSEFATWDDIGEMTANFTFDPEWLGPRLTHPASHLGPRPLWSLVRPACSPDSATRTMHVFDDIWDPECETSEEHSAAALLPNELPEGGVRGYAKSYANTIDVCRQPHLQGLHSAFISPNSMSVTKKLFPLFGDSKLAMSSEILIPGAKEWNVSIASPDSPNIPWEKRVNKLFWRGPATKSRASARYWQRFQSERFVSMLNATHVEIAEASIHSGNESTVGVGYANNFRLLPANEYHIASQTRGQLAEWVNGWVDAAFTDLHCDRESEEDCAYFDQCFTIDSHEQIARDSNAKYAAVVDGEGGDDGGELIQQLRNGKVTLRASIYRKWYDSRLVPWLHFIPMDNTFVELYGIMEYFLGTNVSQEARVFPHAVGEVQKHEHHFKTPSMETEEGNKDHEDTKHHGETVKSSHHDGASVESSPVVDGHSSQVGNEPHHFKRSYTMLNNRQDGDHDGAAKKIAEASRKWAAKVLRREDALVYMYRLLLEYARILDDRRERLGWVEDLSQE
jgi:hypothetical protein